MATTRTETARGRITIVQEGRFRLATDAGQNLLLTLAPGANIDADDLRRLRQSRARVIVDYEGEPGLASALARAIRMT